MPGLTGCEGQSAHHSSCTCPAPFPRRVSSMPLIPIPPPPTHPPTDDHFCSIFTTLLRSWPSAVHARSKAYAQGTVTGAVDSTPAIAGVRTGRRHRRSRQCIQSRRRGRTAPSPAPSGVSTPSHCKRIRKECGRLPTPFLYMLKLQRVDVASLKNQTGDPQIIHIRYPRRSCRRSVASIPLILRIN